MPPERGSGHTQDGCVQARGPQGTCPAHPDRQPPGGETVGFRCVSRPSWGFTPRKPAQSPILPGTLLAEGLGVPWGCGLPRGPWEGSGGLACSRSKIERSPADFLPTMAGLNPRAAGRHRKGAQVSASESPPDTNMTLSPGLLGSPVGSEPQTGGRGGATLPLVPSAGHPGGLPGGCGSPLLQKYLSWGGRAAPYSLQRDSTHASHYAWHSTVSSECQPAHRTGLAAAGSELPARGSGPTPAGICTLLDLGDLAWADLSTY